MGCRRLFLAQCTYARVMYIYTCVDDDGLPWKCERPSDVGRLRGVNLVLYLVRSPADDYWYAIDAAADVVGGASAILQVGHLIFRSTGNASLFKPVVLHSHMRPRYRRRGMAAE